MVGELGRCRGCCVRICLGQVQGLACWGCIRRGFGRTDEGRSIISLSPSRAERIDVDCMEQ